MAVLRIRAPAATGSAAYAPYKQKQHLQQNNDRDFD
jgi:hypothetical protein